MKSRKLMFAFVSVFCLVILSVYAVPMQAEERGANMHTYIILFSFTAEGIQNIKDSPARVEAAKDVVRNLGGEMKAFYGVLGAEFDTIFIIKAPDDEAVAKMALAIASGGNVRTETHRLFSDNEYRRLISELP